MSGRRLAGGLLAYFIILALSCAWIRHHYGLLARSDGEVIASVWQRGRLTARVTMPREDRHDPRLAAALAVAGAQLVFEQVLAEGPIFAGNDLCIGLSFVAGHEGVRATVAGASTLITPDELVSAQVYDHGPPLADWGVSLGLDTDKLFTMVGERLQLTVAEVRARASWRRVRFSPSSSAPDFTGETLAVVDVRNAAEDAARHLARGVSDQGRYRYSTLATTNQDLGGYDWPRHAGATYFLAQAWRVSRDPELREAALRAAAGMTRGALTSCAGQMCIGDEDVVTLGSSALALLAYGEIVSSGLEPGYQRLVLGLSAFVRAQQRADGEFMHRFDRRAQRPIDVQGLYYSGEAALALARAYPVTHERADLDAASRAVSYLVGPGWHFLGNHNYYGEEHWTCQAMAALWSDAPNRPALDFCVRWQDWNRALQQHRSDAVFDADGAFGLLPWVTPRLTPVASRCEAGLATLQVAELAGVEADQLRAMDTQVRRALALLLRRQFEPGPAHLFADPDAVRGALPGSEVDWSLRIDYAQHAGSAMLRWVDQR